MATVSPEMTLPDLPSYIEVIEKFLHCEAAPYDCMLITELDGYFAGVLTSTEVIMPSEWLPPIWGDDGDPTFDNETQAQEVIGAIMEMYNDTNQTLENRIYAPLYDIDNDNTPMWEIWIEGFWKSTMLRNNMWAAILNDGLNHKRQHAAITLTRLHQLSHINETGGRLREGDDILLKNAANIIPASIEELYNYRNIPVETRAKAKIGRNDPCICGSGKKFKKCCLQ